ncbi:MAG: hypothetical protein J6I74_07285, partial [Schwartzia sp.]|nr:hypothetical protein [Schwartzia sp. (in: firmicutes)]
MAQKKNLKQKLAVAMSVVNALNVGAAVALPYANMTQSIVADGAKIEQLVDGVAGAMYGTAHAEHITSTITAGQVLDGPNLGEVTDGVITVEAGGQTSKTTLGGTDTTSGVEIVHNGGTAKDTTTNPGGVLELHSGARLRKEDTVDIEYNQYVLNGGTLRLKEDTAGQYVEIANYHITNGTLELANGGKATGTRLDAAGGNHGVEVIKNGGLSQQGIINNG